MVANKDDMEEEISLICLPFFSVFDLEVAVSCCCLREFGNDIGFGVAAEGTFFKFRRRSRERVKIEEHIVQQIQQSRTVSSDLGCSMYFKNKLERTTRLNKQNIAEHSRTI